MAELRKFSNSLLKFTRDAKGKKSGEREVSVSVSPRAMKLVLETALVIKFFEYFNEYSL